MSEFKRGFMFVLSLIAAVTIASASDGQDATAPLYRIATFSADVTIPIGHACMGGGIAPAREIVDPLEARGLVLLGPDKPIVIVAVDWCEIRNDAYDRWRNVLADAAGTVPQRVMLTSVHQHDAPVCDLTAQKLLDEVGLKNTLCDPVFHEEAVQRVARALTKSLASPLAVTHYGAGRAKVEQVASNRRVVNPEGKVGFPRNSATKDPAIRAASEGTIDPYLSTLSFWNGPKQLAAINIYATHPMSYYGQGGVSADFVGMARRKRQADDAAVFQIYMTGCGGDVTAGKYNDGAKENRTVLADRLHRGMVAAVEATKRFPLETMAFRCVPLRLEPRETAETLRQRLSDPSQRTFHRNLAAMGLSWHQRCAKGQQIDVPAIDLGKAILLLLPAESFVEYQLLAQRARPDSLVLVAGYAECAPGYIPTDQAIREGFEDVWCWIKTPTEPSMAKAIQSACVNR